MNFSHIDHSAWIPDSLRPLWGCALGNDTGESLFLAVALSI
ncbi:MAG: hypothetical protein ABIE07_11570 [Candidatus Zixiibacteriota bacterium]